MGIFKALDNLSQSLADKIRHAKISEPIFMNENTEDARLVELKKLLTSANDEQKKLIEKEIKFIEIGNIGESNVIYELKHSKEKILVLHDLTIEDSYKDSQIDFLIISKSCIIVLETKKLSGDIEITNDGDFIRYLKNYEGKVYKKIGIYSPITQNKYHINAVKDLLVKNKFIKKLPFYSLVVIADPKTIINKKFATKEVKDQIVKYDQLNAILRDIIKPDEYTEFDISDERMIAIAEFLLTQNKPRVYDYSNKFNITEDIKEKNTDCSNEEIIKALKSFRWKQSQTENVKPYMIFNNNEMDELISRMPKSIDELKTVKGFGEVKANKYGKQIIDILNK